MSLPLPGALLFDMDGTLIDSDAWWFAAESTVFGRLGFSWTPAESTEWIGASLLECCEYVTAKGNLAIAPEALRDELAATVAEIAASSPISWRPGAWQLLELTARLGIPSALVSSSYGSFTRTITHAAPAGTLTGRVSGDMVTRAKPDPEGYLLGAAMLGVEPERCLTFEDSAPGMEAAINAGTHAVYVPFSAETPTIPGMTLVESLELVDETMLRDLAALPVLKLTAR
ncbi:MAG: HAD family hydrolase [Ancrocorticia sp.]|uniref:HAD family hydrolase n=2 Tax=Ancrocorticia sp. TaxID=2593684 RepID=UPI003F8E6BC8